jgi:protein-S-isoprenylcysteine O-methyltransferase Ste14
MPTAVSIAVIVLVFDALLIFSWQQFRAGGRWGQRPSAQRAVPLGGVLFVGGVLLGVAGCRRPQPSSSGGRPPLHRSR